LRCIPWVIGIKRAPGGIAANLVTAPFLGLHKAVMAIGADAFEFAFAEERPVTSMGGDVVGDRRDND
jgi:hypothetical protein